MLNNKSLFVKILSFVMAIGCAVMILLGLWSYFGIFEHFKRYPIDSSRGFYNKFYFLPYFMLMFGCLCHTLAGFTQGLRLCFSSIMLGMAIFCFFLSNAGGIGHDFGHVLFGGCFESVQYDSLIFGFNVFSMLCCGYIVSLNYVGYYREKLSNSLLNRVESNK